MMTISSMLDRVLPWRGVDHEVEGMIGRIWAAAQSAAEARRMRDALAISHHDGINHTPAFAIALEGHLALIREGLAPEAQIVSWDDQAILATIDGEPVGVMLWRKPDHWRDVTLDLGYVRPAFRRLGVYRAMWDALVVCAQDCGARRITSVTSVDNADMRAVAVKLGRREATIGLWYDVPLAAAEPAP